MKESGGATWEHNLFPGPLCALNAVVSAVEASSFRAGSKAKPVLLALRTGSRALLYVEVLQDFSGRVDLESFK